jgi:Lon protease-like protein
LSTSKKEEAKSLLEDLTQKFKNSEVFKKKLETMENTVQKEDPLCKISNELDCGLCFRTYFEPITTPCGHTFCRECLARALDYAQKCPLCRAPIHCRPEVHPVTVIINDLVQKYKLDDYLERQKENEESKKLTTSNVPFFCLDYVLFPTSHLPLHIFEPKYRLMIRRCMEGGRCFGLVPIIDGEISKVGTIARIETLNVLPDGRSVIKTVGQERFKILDVWEQDGYKMGKIEYFEESKEKLEEKDTKPIIELATNLFNSFGDETQKSIQEKYGNFPDGSNVDNVIYWVSSILPIANSSKMEILEEVSTKQKVKKLMGLANELMTSNSCSIM